MRSNKKITSFEITTPSTSKVVEYKNVVEIPQQEEKVLSGNKTNLVVQLLISF